MARGRVCQQSSRQLPVVRPWSAGGTIHDHHYRHSSIPLPCICAQARFSRALCLRSRFGQRGSKTGGHPSPESHLCGIRSHGCAHGTRGAANRGALSGRRSQRPVKAWNSRPLPLPSLVEWRYQAGADILWGVAAGVLLLSSIAPALVFLHLQPQWEKALQGLIILLAVAADGWRSVRRKH